MVVEMRLTSLFRFARVAPDQWNEPSCQNENERCKVAFRVSREYINKTFHTFRAGNSSSILSPVSRHTPAAQVLR